jgi:hypothetical protein
MGALLRQFASSRLDTAIKEPVAREYEARKRQADDDFSRLKELTIDDCTRLIRELTHDSQATIVIDVLDECDDSGQLLRVLQLKGLNVIWRARRHHRPIPLEG